MSQRIAWADAARGVGILLVVLGHSWRGLNDAGLIGWGTLFSGVDTSVYLFHMPLFFLLSGMFFVRSVRHRELPGFVFGKVFTLVYPYFLWSAVLIVVNALSAGLVNKPFSLSAVWSLPVQPVGPFWFLYALFFVQAIGVALFGLLRASAWTAVGVGLLLSTASSFVEPSMLHEILFHFLFFAAGAALMESARVERLPVDGRFAAVCAVLYLAGLALALPSGLPFSAPALVPLSFLGIAAVIGLSHVCTVPPAARRLGWLTALGRASMAIYVMHTLFTAGTRILLLKGLGIASLPVHLTCGMAAGLLCPMMVHAVIRRFRLEPLFGFAVPRVAAGRVALSGS